MMAITEEDIGFLIFQRLLASVAVSTIVGDRVKPDTLDQKQTLPAIRYEMIASESFQTLQKSGHLMRTRIQVDCYGATRLQANTVAAAVKNNLDGFSGILGSLQVFSCVLDNRFDSVDPPQSGGATWRKRRTMDFVIVHTEPTPSLN